MEQRIDIRKNWFNDWFNTAFYHRLYAHRNEKEAADFIDELVSELQPADHSAMLDLGCGNGRHAKQLASRGFNVVGLDLAYSSIRDAKKWETESLHFYKHDMRDPFGANCFDYVFNFFTSFGYFNSEEENNRVMHNIYNSLKPNGWVLFDYMNALHAEKCLVLKEEKEIDGIIYKLERWTDSSHIYKKIVIDDVLPGQPFCYTEKVTKFTVEDFSAMFQTNRLRLQKVYGDYSLNEYDHETSPRLILLAQKLT